MNKTITITENFVEKLGGAESVDKYIEDYKNKLIDFYKWNEAGVIFTSRDSCGIWDNWRIFMPCCKVIFFENKRTL